MLTKTQNMGTTTKINPESSPLVLFVRIEMLIMQFYSGLIIWKGKDSFTKQEPEISELREIWRWRAATQIILEFEMLIERLI